MRRTTILGSTLAFFLGCSSPKQHVTVFDSAIVVDSSDVCPVPVFQDIDTADIVPMPSTGGSAPPMTNILFYSEKQSLSCDTNHLPTQNGSATDLPHTLRAQTLTAVDTTNLLPDELGILAFENGADASWPSGATGEAAEGATFPPARADPYVIAESPEADPFVHPDADPMQQPPGTVRLEVFGYADVDFAANNGSGSDGGFYLAVAGNIFIDTISGTTTSTPKFSGHVTDVVLRHFVGTSAAADACEANVANVSWHGGGSDAAILKSTKLMDQPTTPEACAAGSAFAGRSAEIKYGAPPRFTREEWAKISAEVRAWRVAHGYRNAR